ncbi:MAG: ABC transporter permease [Oscillospiraceae bacterium]|nr:ABC transporter permease [Oscillospiraceae bacterium]
MKIGKKQIVLCGAAAASLLVSGVLALVSSILAGSLQSQHAAERWADGGDVPYAQVSVFAGTESMLYEGTVESLRESVTNALKQAAMEQQKNGPRLWYDAYSTQGSKQIMKGTKRGSVTAEVTVIGGDFFMMHPLQLVDGSYIGKDDLMQDRLVIDEKLAWDLFGSSQVSGMTIDICGKRCPVAGVVRLEQDSASRKIAGDAPRAFMSYTLYNSLTGSDSYGDYYEGSSSAAGITCYEIVMPDLVRGYAKKQATDALGEPSGMYILQNTGRYSLEQRWKTATHLSEMVIIPDSVSYPYWENAARLRTFQTALLLWGEILFMVYPVLLGLVLLWKGYCRLNRFLQERRLARKNQYRTTLDIQV